MIKYLTLIIFLHERKKEIQSVTFIWYLNLFGQKWVKPRNSIIDTKLSHSCHKQQIMIRKEHLISLINNKLSVKLSEAISHIRQRPAKTSQSTLPY